MATTWEEVSVTERENRRELVLRGPHISKRIEEHGLDPNIFKLVSLNYLEISGTSLGCVSASVGELVNLTSLVLCNNQITDVSGSVGKLTKLKVLNLSYNKIETVPEEICSLGELDTINLSANQLEELPSFANLKSIHVINLSNNKLTALPEDIDNPDLVHLSQLLAGDNELSELTADFFELPHLNCLDLSNNKLNETPSHLCNCVKLKELNLKGNKFKDRRFGKLVDQCGTKQVMEYLENIFKKENQKSGKGKEKEMKKKSKKKGKKVADDVEEIAKDIMSILKFPGEPGVVIEVTPAVLSVRQYIVCCLVRNLDFHGSKNMFKNFISLQTRLHDTVCEKRQAATIATHDFKSVKLPLKYDAKFPQILMVTPLFKRKEVSGEKLFEDLRKEADELRKEKKRNTFSGIHKYLDLLADKTHYPCLVDRDGSVISFPPITNSDITKISPETTDILIEVTSSTNLDTCKKIMDELLYKMLDMGLSFSKGNNSKGASAKGDNSDSEESDDGGVVFEDEKQGKKPTKQLVVEQVKVVDNEGGLKVLYPSRTDLKNDAIKVIRNFD